jgi:ketosteroid isomerase-like protein
MQQQRTVEKELLAREQRYWTAIKDKDADTAARLSDDPCLVVGAQGVSELTRSAMSKMMANPTYELHEFSLEDVHFRHVNDDVVVLAYKVHEDMTVEGQKVKLEAFDSSVWMKRDGDWICVAHTEACAGDPFGRAEAPARRH